MVSSKDNSRSPYNRKRDGPNITKSPPEPANPSSVPMMLLPSAVQWLRRNMENQRRGHPPAPPQRYPRLPDGPGAPFLPRVSADGPLLLVPVDAAPEEISRQLRKAASPFSNRHPSLQPFRLRLPG